MSQVETLEWTGGNTVVNCHDSGITLAGLINVMNTTGEMDQALAAMSRNPERKPDEVFSRHGELA
jgi:hypothetical protein